MHYMVIRTSFCCAVMGSFLLVRTALGAFHVMQIEQVIGGVNGDTSAQAIQLRMRSAGQSVVSLASLWAADATGANRVLLLNINSNVTNSATGSRVLLTTSGFANYIAGSFTPDFTLTNPIPSSYLSAGRLTFEDDGGNASTPGTIYWSLSWGGAGYTGPTTGDPTNDSNSNFGPSFGSALTSLNLQSLIFSGAATAGSTSNSADYALSSSPATFTKNSGAAFSLSLIQGDYQRNRVVNANDYGVWRQNYGSPVAAAFNGADGNGNSVVDAGDYIVWRKASNTGSGTSQSLASRNNVPEPATTVLSVLLLFFLSTRARRCDGSATIP
jgi:hypothetical protein